MLSAAIAEARQFDLHLRQIKQTLAEPAWEWYPYGSLSNIEHLAALLGGRYPALEAALFSGRVLDVGCADGDLAFFLESRGAAVTAIDHAATHHNALQGVRKMAAHLGSRVEILACDLDDGALPLGGREFDIGLILGVLYHLRNPLLVLDRLSHRLDFALFSTRIFSGDPRLERLPLAYLLGDDELNADDSNFWLPTLPGLTRMMERSGWELGATLIREARANRETDPWKTDRRVFAVARSTVGLRNLRLLDGWHAPEQDGWRWTAPEFSFEAAAFRPEARRLHLDIYIHPDLFPADGRPVEAELQIGGGRERLRLARPGTQVLAVPYDFPEAPTRVGIRLGNRVPAPAGDPREFGMIVKRAWFR